MTPSANRVIIQTVFKSAYIVFKAPEALFTVKSMAVWCVYKSGKIRGV